MDADLGLDFLFDDLNVGLGSNNPLEPVTMAHDPDAIYKALRMVPDFDGNPNILTRFIKLCDQIVEAYMSNEPGNELTNLCLLNGILNKITGTAACTINSNGIPDNWLGIRNALINSFSDQRDETALYNDLSIASQSNKTPQEFYAHCQSLLSTIMTYVSLHEVIGTTVEAKRELYRKVAMQAFVRGLNEPLGSRIRCMRPDSIEKALEFVQEELNVMYVQQRSEHPKAPQNHRVTIPPMPTPSVGYVPPRPINIPQAPAWPAPIASQPPPPVQPFRFNNQNNPRPQAQNRMPSRTQQMFRALPPNYNPRSNVFRLPPRDNSQFNTAPRPMSGVQSFTPRVLPNLNQNFSQSHELNMNACAPYTEPYYSGYYAESDYICYEPYYAHYSDFNEYDNAGHYSELNSIDYQPTEEVPPQHASTSDDVNFQIDSKSPKPR